REIARRSLERLIKDRRIRPSLIEEVVEKTKKEMDRILTEEGQKVCSQAGVYRLPPELIQLLGRYKFRFSYGQNLVAHTLEVVKIGMAVAQELKADLNVVRLGCLLHDIGKVVPDEEGSHVELGIAIAKKYHLPEAVVQCIAEHHEDRPFSTPESRIVWVADAISGARPGARYESHEEYVKRMRDIEEAGSSFKGVQAVYAYQAGRDVRVMVKPEEVDDAELVVLAQKIRDHLEEKVSYVGQVKVTCIREIRASETTKGK
ncbi:HDIG domain-containing protein, partial [Patescibacteria group bacterium]|nr:HDIG domain-containing protein [Patescibacteria group bacterium]